MAIVISGTTGIDMGNTPVSNVDVGALQGSVILHIILGVIRWVRG